MLNSRCAASLGPSEADTVSGNLCEKESEKQDDGDPDQLLQCPYDKNHQIRACRFPFHIIKCGKNHPKLASELQSCPFNAKHLMPKHELSRHIDLCEDKRHVCMEDDGNTEAQHRFKVPFNPWKGPDPEEDWDKEADDCASTFMWGVSTNPLPQNKPEYHTTKSLASGLRAPHDLPWKF